VTGQKDRLLEVLRQDDAWVALNERTPESPTEQARREAAEASDEEDDEETEEVDERPYSQWKVEELRDEAKARGLDTKDLNKADLVTALEADDAEDDEEA
jgi:hypothetical protein